jgi:hypothetical protein
MASVRKTLVKIIILGDAGFGFGKSSFRFFSSCPICLMGLTGFPNYSELVKPHYCSGSFY